MLIIGLTGSLATGKSTVARILSSPPYSLPLIDADIIARQAVEPGTRAYSQIIKQFGPSTPDLLLPPTSSSSPPLNRAALGRRVFGAAPALARDRAVLNSIVHPAVRIRLLQVLLRYYFLGAHAVVVDVPLLFEGGLDVCCGVVIMVAVRDPALQMRRLRIRDKDLSADEAQRRVESQGGCEEKVGRTRERRDRGVVVWNDGGMEELRKEVDTVVRRWGLERRGWWAWWLWMSPLAALCVALGEFWRGWRARRRWEKREKEKKGLQ